MINEQVKELREYADKYKTSQEAVFGTIKVLNQAADTIESFSAKLEEPKWIPYRDRLPEEPPKITLNVKEVEQMIDNQTLQEYIVTTHIGEQSTALYYAGDGWWYDRAREVFGRAAAWQPLPEPYKLNNPAAVQKGEES